MCRCTALQSKQCQVVKFLLHSFYMLPWQMDVRTNIDSNLHNLFMLIKESTR